MGGLLVTRHDEITLSDATGNIRGEVAEREDGSGEATVLALVEERYGFIVIGTPEVSTIR